MPTLLFLRFLVRVMMMAIMIGLDLAILYELWQVDYASGEEIATGSVEVSVSPLAKERFGRCPNMVPS